MATQESLTPSLLDWCLGRVLETEGYILCRAGDRSNFATTLSREPSRNQGITECMTDLGADPFLSLGKFPPRFESGEGQ
jgi:hypothetical protein